MTKLVLCKLGLSKFINRQVIRLKCFVIKLAELSSPVVVLKVVPVVVLPVVVECELVVGPEFKAKKTI